MCVCVCVCVCEAKQCFWPSTDEAHLRRLEAGARVAWRADKQCNCEQTLAFDTFDTLAFDILESGHGFAPSVSPFCLYA